MKTSAFFIACGSLALCLIASDVRAQIPLPPRAQPKLPDIPPPVPPLDDAWAKSQQERADMFNKAGKQPLIPPLNLKPPAFSEKDWALRKSGSPTQQQAAPAQEYSPRTGSRTASTAPAQAPAPPAAQPATPERKPAPQAAVAVPAKPPCVYKAVMSNDEIAACR